MRTRAPRSAAHLATLGNRHTACNGTGTRLERKEQTSDPRPPNRPTSTSGEHYDYDGSRPAARFEQLRSASGEAGRPRCPQPRPRMRTLCGRTLSAGMHVRWVEAQSHGSSSTTYEQPADKNTPRTLPLSPIPLPLKPKSTKSTPATGPSDDWRHKYRVKSLLGRC